MIRMESRERDKLQSVFKDKAQLLDLFEKYVGEEMTGESHFYQTFGQRTNAEGDANSGWNGVMVAFRCSRELDAGGEFVAATMAEVVPWQILKRAAELGERMKKMGVSTVEAVPGWCDLLNEQGEELPEKDEEDSLT